MIGGAIIINGPELCKDFFCENFIPLNFLNLYNKLIIIICGLAFDFKLT